MVRDIDSNQPIHRTLLGPQREQTSKIQQQYANRGCKRYGYGQETAEARELT